MESTIIEKIRQLPPDLQEEVILFIDFLQTKNKKRRKKRPTLEWGGGLIAYRDQFTSVELQKKASEWRD